MEAKNQRTDNTSTPNLESSHPPNNSEPQPQASGSAKKVDPAWEAKYQEVKRVQA